LGFEKGVQDIFREGLLVALLPAFIVGFGSDRGSAALAVGWDGAARILYDVIVEQTPPGSAAGSGGIASGVER